MSHVFYTVLPYLFSARRIKLSPDKFWYEAKCNKGKALAVSTT